LIDFTALFLVIAHLDADDVSALFTFGPFFHDLRHYEAFKARTPTNISYFSVYREYCRFR